MMAQKAENQQRNPRRWCFNRFGSPADCVLETNLAKAAEVIIHWFWFNGNKDLNQPASVNASAKTRKRARQIISLRHDANASASTLNPDTLCSTKISTNSSRLSFSEFSFPLSSNFQSAALVYALFVLLACCTR